LVVDLGRGSATITGPDGEHFGTWSGLTTRGTPAVLVPEGWHLTRPFEVDPFENGMVAPVWRT